MNLKKTKPEEFIHLREVKKLRCIVCKKHGPSHAHHCFTGMGRRKNHWHTIPLCYKHHQGEEGINSSAMGKKVWESLFGTEMDLLEKAYKLLNYSNCPPFERVFDNDKKGIVKRRIHKD